MAYQAKKILHASNVFHNEWAGKLAELLVTLTQREGGLGWAAGAHEPPSTHPASDAPSPGHPGAKVFFANSGTEANEGALKIARKVGKDRARAAGKTPAYKTGIVCFAHAFHGRSLGALSVTPNEKYQAPFAPLLPDVKVGVLNDFGQLERGLVDDAVCAVIVEPIQGEGGCTAAETEWLRALRRKCDEHGAVLIYDEVQVGGAPRAGWRHR
jgi:acetylornithine aminotransferase